jgi:glycosyltransferase involved in cell wall biosynthesis
VENATIYSHPNMAIFPGRESAEALDGLLESFRAEIAYGKIQFCTMKDLELVTRASAPVPAGVSPNSEAYAYAISPVAQPAPDSAPAVVTPVTIMAPCRNEKKGIGKLLDSILAQDMTGLDWEVIIADGMSDDGTRETLKQYTAKHPRIRVIDNPGLIVSTGLNAALGEAKGEVILRMDAHTEYAPDYVRTCVDTLVRTGAQNVGGPARTRSSGAVQRAIALAYKNPFACGGAKFHLADFEGYVDTVPYGCWRKSTLTELGGFDESLVRNQDDELNLRLARSGGKIYQSPHIKSWYHPRDRLSRLYRQYFQYGFWKVAVIRKHRVPASMRHVIPVLFVVANLLFLLNAVVSPAMDWDTAWNIGNSLWAAMLGLHLVIGLAAAAKTAVMAGWGMLPLMPLVFFLYHFSYGLGFLCGLLYWPFVRMEKGAPPAKLFTQLSR